MTKNRSNTIKYILLALIVLFAINAYFLFEANEELNEIMSGEKEEVTLIHIKDETCTECVDIEQFFSDFETAGINVEKTLTYDVSDSKAKRLIEKYNIEKLPTIIFSEELGEYTDIAQLWEQVGTVEEDGSYVMRRVTPPYLDLNDNQIKGKVSMIYLKDDSCSECYDVKLHKQIVGGVGVSPSEETTYDISSDRGKEVLNKYGITKIPTVVLSQGAGEYEGISSVWDQVGFVAEDGSYIFTALDVLKVTHKDLETGEIIEGEMPNQ